MSVQLLAHNQVGGVDVVHLLAYALQPVLEPQHGFPQVPVRHAVQLVDGLALGLRHYLCVAVDVRDLLHLDLQSCGVAREEEIDRPTCYCYNLFILCFVLCIF